jgi:D-amino peptidase
VAVCAFTGTAGPFEAGGVHAQERQGPRVFISADMEGVAGVVNAEQLGPTGVDWALFRRLMTEEVNAAIAGAFDAGARAVTVADSHGNHLSILPDVLDPRARLIRSAPRPLGMMEGVDGGFDAAFFVGFHASINTPGAVRAHTFSSARYFDVTLNGQHASEALVNAAVAGHFGVPVVLLSGDNVIVDEAHKTISADIEGVVVKRAIGYHSADSVSPETARRLIRDGAARALGRLSSFHPLKVAAPTTVEITFKNMINAEILALLPNVTRVGGPTVRFTGKDIVEVEHFLQVVGSYSSDQ